MTEEKLLELQKKLELFHKGTGGRLPNVIILPAHEIVNEPLLSEVSGCRVIYGAVQEPTVALVVQ